MVFFSAFLKLTRFLIDSLPHSYWLLGSFRIGFGFLVLCRSHDSVFLYSTNAIALSSMGELCPLDVDNDELLQSLLRTSITKNDFWS